MAKGNFIQNSFNAGEWSPLMDGRVDLAKYGNAAKRLENFVIDPRGPAVMRPGFKYIAGTKTNGTASILIPFEFSEDVAYIVEIGNLYARFYRDQAQITSGGSPVEVVLPYATADLAEIKYCQSADVLYLFHPDYAIRKLSRTSDTAWTVTAINFRPGPSYEEPLEPNTTLTLAAVTGTSVNFTAGAAVFQTGDVGRLIVSGAGRASITAFTSTSVVVCDIIDDFASVGPIASGSWELQGSPVGTLDFTLKGPVGSIVTVTAQTSEVQTALLDNGSNYWTVSGSGTGEYYLLNTAPFYSATKPDKVYLNGIERTEGTAGSLSTNQWDFADNDTLGYNTIYVRLGDSTDPDSKASSAESYVTRGDITAAPNVFRSTDVGKYIRVLSGFVKITAYTSAIVVKGEILKELVSDETSPQTDSWTLESDMWSSTLGYPSCGVFFENRLFVAGSTSFPETVWGSVSGDYENFVPGTDDSDAIQFSLASRQISVIRWMETRDFLIVGCIGGEWKVGPEDSGSPLTPLNVVAKQMQTKGCANISPVTIEGSTLYLQRAGRKIREFTYQFESDGYVAPDLTLLAEHITAGGIVGMAYQQEPLSILWCVRTDGKLIGLTYLRDQDVIGWHIHETDGLVESVAVIPGDGYDELWMVVKRTINGGDVRYVEMMEAFFEDSNTTYKANKGLNAFFVDSGITYNGASTTTITGLDHLEGETVSVLADASVGAAKVVASGQITLDVAATVVHVGLPYTALIQTMKFNTQLQDGTAQGRQKRIVSAILKVNESGMFKLGRDEDNLQTATEQVINQTTGGISFIINEAPDLYTGDTRPYILDSEWDRYAQMVIVQDKPLPLTVLSIIPGVAT